MDGKTGFGVVLALTGIFIAFLAVTGRASAIIAAISGKAPDTSTPPTTQVPQQLGGASGSASGAGAPPQQVLSGAPTTSSNVGAVATYPSDILSAIEFNSLIGTDGVKAVPYTPPVASS